jgi:hypothetical protein
VRAEVADMLLRAGYLEGTDAEDEVLFDALTATPVSIDPCVLVSGHETIFEGAQIEGALSRRCRDAQGRDRKDLLGVDANHKALAKEASGKGARRAKGDPRQASQERGDAPRVAAQAPPGQP